MFDLAGLVGFVWFGLFEFVFLLQVVVPLKVAKTSLELHLETIPGRIGSGWVGLIVIIKLSMFNNSCTCNFIF